ncbi:MAG: hypothetical protein KKB30_10055 [Proteobacteria bacterium]|nr:hypothetical protein [Pseudomonadota bacterium]MBU1716393.1 hypothetical protein [Pseudomonadota bacterium]
MKKILLIIGSMFYLIVPAWADDTDIYGISNIDVKPNVLIIFDNSGSMGTSDVQGSVYEPATNYTGSYSQNAVYQNSKSYFTSINDSKWQCAAAKTDLLNLGWWKGKLTKDKKTGVVSCGGKNNTNYRLGNFENFDALPGSGSRTRMEVAKEVMAKLINDNFERVNFGLMKFNLSSANESGFIVAGCGGTRAELIGDYNAASPPIFTDSVQALYGAIGSIESSTYTPLAETMAEAGLYYAGQKSWFNGLLGQYTSDCTSLNKNCLDYNVINPIEYRCQKNYIILMTDGEPTEDANTKLKNSNYINSSKIPDAHMDGAVNYLEDVTYFLAHNDLRVVGGSPPTEADILAMGSPGNYENQTVTTYTIGFQQNLPLLEEAATNGGGEYYTADNADTLNEALNSIIDAIGESNESFSAAAVPVSRANKAYAGEYVYYGLFQPLNSGGWLGNLKKYGLSYYGDKLLDVNGNIASLDGVVLDGARSFWSDPLLDPDGPDVARGGAGEKLYYDIENGFSRKIYTYTGTANLLTDSSNEFSLDNKVKLNTYVELSDSVISKVRRENAGEWPLGDFLHSQPVVVHYDDNFDGADDHSMVFAGANDGMLHCIDDNDGSEIWAYIPSDLLDKLSLLTGNTHEYFVDGSPQLYPYNDGFIDKKLLFFGERRGGDSYTALDITDYNSPLLHYEIGPTILGPGHELLGQSWSNPQVVDRGTGVFDVVNNKEITNEVLLLVGGYDDNQDSLPTDDPPPNPTDSKGRAVFAVDAQTGALQEDFVFSADNFPAMTHSIVAASAFKPMGQDAVNRVYAGDMNGNLFGFRRDGISYYEVYDKKEVIDGKEYTIKNVARAVEIPDPLDGSWGQKLKLYSTPGQKIFYSPNILDEYFTIPYTNELGRINRRVMTGMDWVYYGTGDRAHPDRKDITNGFYAIKNRWDWHESEDPEIVEAIVDVSAQGSIIAKDNPNRVLVGPYRDLTGIILTDTDGYPFAPEDVVVEDVPFIIDVTDNLIQNREADPDVRRRYQLYAEDAIKHSNNRGWFIRLEENVDGVVESVGEKVVSSPLIYNHIIYFTTFVPEDPATVEENALDPCASPGARGIGYLYKLDNRTGAAVQNFYTVNDEETGDDGQNIGKLDVHDRRMVTPTRGIPPEPTMVIQPGGASILVGTYAEKVEFSAFNRFFWRQLEDE